MEDDTHSRIQLTDVAATVDVDLETESTSLVGGGAPQRKKAVRMSEEVMVVPRRWIYLSEDVVDRLKRYKYSGVDESIYYNYVGSPLAQMLTERVLPLWVAPNLITVTGFMIILSAHFLLWAQTPLMTENYSSWIATTCGISTLVYQTLDNMDGKQARRTKTSSPLGQLFDHGCDSLTLTLLSINIASLIGLTPKQLALLFSANLAGFFVTLWEEFHTHKFRLPIINGPNEGLVLISLLCFLAASKGREWFSTTKILSETTFTDALFAAFLLSASITVLGHLWRTLTSAPPPPRDGSSRVVFVGTHRAKAVLRLLPMVFMCVFVLVMAETPQVIQAPRIFYWTVGLNFTLLDTFFMLRMLCDEEPTMWPKHMWPMFAILILSLLYSGGHTSFDPAFLMLAYFLFMVAYTGYVVKNLVNELCLALNIFAFTIPA